jgi:hypothetical protein
MSHVVIWFGGAIGAVVLVFGLLHLVNRMTHRWHNSHPGLFSSLCRLHQLDRNARRLLRQVAQHHRLAQPGRLFIEPQWLDPLRLGPSLRARSPEIIALRGRLFDLESASEA